MVRARMKMNDGKWFERLRKALEVALPGQEKAVLSLAASVAAAELGLRPQTGPRRSFLLAGPLGVGQRAAAWAVACELFSERGEDPTWNTIAHWEPQQTFAKAAPSGGVVFVPALQAAPESFRRELESRLRGGSDFDGWYVFGAVDLLSDKALYADSGDRDWRKRIKAELESTLPTDFLSAWSEIVLFRPLQDEALQAIAEIVIAELVRDLNAGGAFEVETTPRFIEEMAVVAARHASREYGVYSIGQWVTSAMSRAVAAASIEGLLRGRMRVNENLSGYVVEPPQREE
ncbi:MAG: hypothetical protein PHO89_01290 [Methylacidiphilaceae bacterium]|nr:hypothetical protein [Candidatus Methylacidiphilaceae bacterium]